MQVFAVVDCVVGFVKGNGAKLAEAEARRCTVRGKMLWRGRRLAMGFETQIRQMVEGGGALAEL
jgi:hypothetical protein